MRDRCLGEVPFGRKWIVRRFGKKKGLSTLFEDIKKKRRKKKAAYVLRYGGYNSDPFHR